MKICKKCGADKPDSEFYNVDRTCKVCRRALAVEYRNANLEHYREYDRTRFKNDPRVRERNSRYQKSAAGKASTAKARKKWLERNTIKRAASTIVGNAVRDGRLEKHYECSQCGAGGRIHGHHDDYAYPMVVRWLCSKCHTAWHKENGEGLNA
jgi:ribosomal protein S27AE